jgi:CheY-like chemotaxis protein
MASESILLVEDNADDEALILRALRRANVTNTIHIVRDGAEALQYLLGDNDAAEPAQALPTVVLLDLKLPKINGLEVLQRLRASERAKTLPIVILTSSDEQDDIAGSYRLGVNSYVRKPVEFAEFSRVVAELGLY